MNRPIIVSITLLVLGFSTNSMADRWTPTELALEAAYDTLLTVDYLQTKQGINSWTSSYTPAEIDAMGGGEQNPIMGRRGERLAPEIYFPLAAAAHVAVGAVLPSRWRKVWQGVTIAIQFEGVRGNWNAGYTLSF